MPGLENQEWWVKRALCPRGNSPHSPRLLLKFVDMLGHINKITCFSGPPASFFPTRMGLFISHSEAFPVKVVSTKSVGYQVRGQFTQEPDQFTQKLTNIHRKLTYIHRNWPFAQETDQNKAYFHFLSYFSICLLRIILCLKKKKKFN